jgi:polysaccharide export outer membrane protein
VWAAEVPSDRSSPDPERTTIEAGDVIAVTVVAQAALSGQQPVGVDGTIAIPNVGAVPVAGKSTNAAEAAVADSLKSILTEPKVSLVVISRSIEISILGEVQGPGKYQLKSGDGIATALALAGGVTEFGNKNAIYLVRDTEPLRVRFRMKDLVRGGRSASAFALRDGDLLIIE